MYYLQYANLSIFKSGEERSLKLRKCVIENELSRSALRVFLFRLVSHNYGHNFARKKLLTLARAIMSAYNFNSSDARVVRASASGVVDSGLIPSRIKPTTLKLVFTASLLDAQQ